MFRIIYRPRAIAIVVPAMILVLSVLGLVFYFVRDSMTNERLLMCILGLILGAVLFGAYGWPVIWEVGPESVRKQVGRRAVADFSLADVGTVRIFVLGKNQVFQSIEIRDGQERLLLRVEKGRLAIQDVREFYEALAYYLPARVALPENPFGWRPRRPEVAERHLPTGEYNWRRLSQHLAASVVHGAGLGLAVGGAMQGWMPHLVLGVLVFALGIALSVILYLREPSRVRW